MTDSRDKKQVNPSETTAARQTVPEWSSKQLLGTAHEARIVHGEEVYRLIRTRNDKLILVK